MNSVQAKATRQAMEQPATEATGGASAHHMRICMLIYDMQPFGGLEEIVAALSVALQEQGHAVSALSAAWIPEDNQYLARLRRHGVPVAQPPKWISLLASDWATKEKIVAAMLWLLTPAVGVLGIGVSVARRRPWRDSWTSARNWLQGQLMARVVGPDQRRTLGRLLLHWWRLRWRPDLLHIQGYTSNLLFAIDWAAAHGIPVVYEEHQTPDARFDWWQDFRAIIN